MPSRALTFALLLLAFQTGCSTPGVLRPREHVSASPPRSDADPHYRVAAGDVLEVKPIGSAPFRSEVRTDGSILLASGSAVRVDEMTTDEISHELEEKLGDQFRACRISVVNYNSQFIYVFGHGRTDGPRAMAYQGRETLREFLSRVGCQNCARGYRVRVVRPGQKMGESPEIVAIKLDADFYNRNREHSPVYLQPNDYVYLERDGSGPGGIMPRSARFWPLTKFTFKFWKRNQKPDDHYAAIKDSEPTG